MGWGGWDSLPCAEVIPEASVLKAWRSILHLLPTLRGMETGEPHCTGEGMERPAEVKGFVQVPELASEPQLPGQRERESSGNGGQMMTPSSSVPQLLLTPYSRSMSYQRKGLFVALWTGLKWLPAPGCLGAQSSFSAHTPFFEFHGFPTGLWAF